MCGRYYIESGWEGEIEDVVQDIDRRIRQEQFIGDVHPTDLAPVIEMENQRLKLNICRWGYSFLQMGIFIIKREKSGYQCKGGICFG